MLDLVWGPNVGKSETIVDYMWVAKFLTTSRGYMYVCMVITYSRVWINRVRLPILLVVSWTGKMDIPLSPYAPENSVSRDGFSCPVPHQPAHSAYPGWIWCLLTGFLQISARRPFIYLERHTPSGQSCVDRVTQFRTDGVHCRESAVTGPVVLKVVPVRSASILKVTIDHLMRLSFPTPTISMKW